jgi:hypothetical protein
LSRIFTVLGVLALVALAATFLLGLYIGDFNSAAERYVTARHEYDRLKMKDVSPSERAKIEREFATASEAAQAALQRKTLHFYLGVASSLLAILVCSISVTYFIGTSRWCKEVVETYRLSPELAKRSDALKRSTFPYTLAGMLTVIILVSLGGLSDPSIPWRRLEVNKGWFNSNFPPAAMVNVHYLAAMVGLFILAASFWIQGSRIAANYGVIDEILAEVKRVRSERGLSTKENDAAEEAKA